MTRGRRLTRVALCGLAAGAASFLTAPSAGVAIHWSDDGSPETTVSAGAFAIFVVLTVLAIGMYCTRAGGEERSARVDVIAAALLVIFCATQGMLGFGVLASLCATGAILALGVVVRQGVFAYAVASWRARSR